jgi:hypothetical protein
MWCLACEKDRGEAETCPKCGDRTIAVEFPSDPCLECENKLKGDTKDIYTVSCEQFGSYTFNVEKARELAQVHARRHRLDRLTMYEFCRVNRTTLGHLPHIPQEKFAEPGLVLEIEFPELNADAIVLVDGTHRAVQALKDWTPYFVHVLPWVYGQQCVMSFTPAEQQRAS